MTTITAVHAFDIRFPTSRHLDGSDAMNPDPDYSVAYCILSTDGGADGHGFTFTLGRGTELCVAAIESLKTKVLGRSLEGIRNDMAGFWRAMVGDSQIRWLGPEKGVVHLAAAAIINAVWDLLAKEAGQPLWRYLAALSPEEVVAAIDFRHVTDALPPERALEILNGRRAGRAERIAALERDGHAAYTTSAGWLGYDDDKIRALAGAAIADGWNAIKMKVGGLLDDDIRRASLLREILGPDRILMTDANQVWEVDQAIAWVRALKAADPYWIEEPVSPDDILGHARVKSGVAPVKVATGEHVQNRVMFKQFLQADAIDVVQLDACRLGGVNEALAVLLLAAAFEKAVCPHAGGVGLCEYVQHISFFDAACVRSSDEGRMTEHAGHLHEHFVDPIRIERGRYMAPSQPGFSAEILAESRVEYAFPDGAAWRDA
ncbi:MAG TPA: enolase C-terminal domain-like protein [Caulobacteraceae bacterium]|nr:enolase C-terminal domain-like protein [Caulobacteraceae bacterium]